MYGKRNTCKTTPYRRKTTTRTKRVYRRRRNYTNVPARLRSNPTKYSINKMINRKLNQFSENKLVACADSNQLAPTAIQTGAQAFFVAYNIGIAPTFTGSYILDGIRILQGVDNRSRIGDYIYLQKTHLTIKLEMINANTVTPTQFRMLVIKLRRYNNPAGVTSVPEESLFLDPDGSKFGHATAGKTGLDLMMQPTNKRDWVILKDQKFTLQNFNQLSTTSAIYNHYPCYKDIQVNLPYYKKTKYGTNNLPIDMDYRYTVIFYAHNVSRETSSEDFEVTTRGTTSYKDN
ncbi:MAG: putative capsid protein [Cressdnaviricota sp.]|nr:MAG: putative capsid protein [Cressdnaviricota sp.]